MEDIFHVKGHEPLIAFAPSLYFSVAPVCSNGVVGVEADGACCVAECGTCGGAGCRSRAEAVGLTSEDCCVQRISDAGVYCDDTETSPCIVNSGEHFFCFFGAYTTSSFAVS